MPAPYNDSTLADSLSATEATTEGPGMSKETAETLSQRAQQAVAQGKNELARQYYQQALGLVSDNSNLHYGMATVCFLLNDLPSSAYHFKEVTRLDPKRASAYINLGAVYNRLEQYDEAIPILRYGIQLDINRAEGYYNLGLVYRRKGQPELAIQAYREAVRVNPRMADAHFNIANIYLEMGQFRSAVAHYRQALEIRPNWEKAYRGLKNAEAAMAAQQDEAPPEPVPIEEPPTTDSSDEHQVLTLDPNRLLDPEVHGNALRVIHQATIDAQTHGVQLLESLEKEVEPAIKELSILLLTPSTTTSALDHCMAKFEEAMAKYVFLQSNLTECISKVRTTGEEFLKS